MADLVTEFSNIPPTFLCDFFLPEKDTLFLNDLEEEFFLVNSIHSQHKLAK